MKPVDSRPEPAGFPDCPSCAYLKTGAPKICTECARSRIEGLAAASDRCTVCDLEYPRDSATCGNPLCTGLAHDRQFSWNFAIAMRTGAIEQAINRYKYLGRYGWRLIFGRLLVGFLDGQRETFRRFDLIIASPTFAGAGGRSRDHTREVVTAAHDESQGSWPFDIGDPPVIIKTADTPRMAGKRFKERREIATTTLRDALLVPDRSRTEGRTILVYDDVFTGGLTLNEVARCLREQGGAQDVCGVSLTRQPYQG